MGVEWTRGATIGRGASATVSLAVDRLTGDVLAVKSVCADRAAELRREQSILCALSSPHVVRCLGGSGRDMLLEYAPGGSLADEIRRRGGRCDDEGLIRRRARDVLRGLAHVHAAGVAHCDVKGRNVLIGADGRAMIADFGCARRIAAPGEVSIGGGGTPMFMAPEAARGEEQGTPADIWALGCTVIEMATGAAPWQRFAAASPVATLHHVAFSGQAPEFPAWLSEQGKDFLGRCLLQDAAERWTAEQLLEHEFVAAADAVSSSSSSVPATAGITVKKAMFVSPKSVLDQALWEEEDEDDDTTADTAADRVRALAAGAADWTWDASWITVHSSGTTDSNDADEERPTMWPEPAEAEADTDSGDSRVVVVGSSGGSIAGLGRVAEESEAGPSNRQASPPHADGDRYDDSRSSSCNGSDDGNHVFSDDDCCTLPITRSNGKFFSDTVVACFVCHGWPSRPVYLFALPVICFAIIRSSSVLTPSLTTAGGNECQLL